MPHVLKIFLKIIQTRINSKIDKEVGPTQFGFRPGSGTREGIFSFNIIAQKQIEVDQDEFVVLDDALYVGTIQLDGTAITVTEVGEKEQEEQETWGLHGWNNNTITGSGGRILFSRSRSH